MLTMLFLSLLLVLGGHQGASGKSVYIDRSLLSGADGRHSVRKQPHQQPISEIRRSLDSDSFKTQEKTTTSRISLPSIIRLYPPTAKPLHMHANMPMRFGRDSSAGDDRAPNSSPNLPQRFGRLIPMCADDCDAAPDTLSPVRPPAIRRNNMYWRLLRTLANMDLHWGRDFDFATSKEEVEIQEKTFEGGKRIS